MRCGLLSKLFGHLLQNFSWCYNFSVSDVILVQNGRQFNNTRDAIEAAYVMVDN